MTHLEILNQQIQQLSAHLEVLHRQLREANYHERTKLFALIELDKEILSNTRYAYQRILSGERQLCERCHRPISPERLEAIPEATLCIQCAREVKNHDHSPAISLTPATSFNDISISL